MTAPEAPGLVRSKVAEGSLPHLDWLEIVGAARYELSEEYGRGGIGRVLRARDRQLHRDVAVKELLSHSPEAEARFLREALITASLEHPGIVPVHELGRRADGTPYYSMKLIEGHTLSSMIDEADDYQDRLKLLSNVVAVAEAIAYAHSRRIVHRDLKPSNIIVGDYGETMVIDWGLAKDLSGGMCSSSEDEASSAERHGVGITSVGQVLGTPAYMPPEQASGMVVNERADVYALGAILYHVLAGKRPYAGQVPGRVLASLRQGGPRPLRQCEPQVPGSLIAIAERAMARDPSDRHAGARAFADELKRGLCGQLVVARPRSWSERVRGWTRCNWPLVTTAAAAVVVITLFATVWFHQEREKLSNQRTLEGALVEARSEHAACVSTVRRAPVELSPGQPGYDPALVQLATAASSDLLFNREPRDQLWAPAKERQLQEAAQAGLQSLCPHAVVELVECRMMMCQLQVQERRTGQCDLAQADAVGLFSATQVAHTTLRAEPSQSGARHQFTVMFSQHNRATGTL